MTALYDRIGVGYAGLRRPDPSIERIIKKGLGDATTVVNVGAGAGSYEPMERSVVSVERSMTMIRQRPLNSAPVVQATALAPPFADDSFDAALAVLTVHHWSDRVKGLCELRRVARHRVVVLTWDPDFPGFWLTDYLPEIQDIDRPIFPRISDFQHALGPISVTDVPIPHDCADGFMCAYWRRPEAYLDQRVRSAISTFAKIGDATGGLRRLSADLQSGEWHSRHKDIVDKTQLDLGYRLIVSQ